MDFLVYSLDTDDDTILEKTLDILKLFIENEKSHSMLKSYFSLIENIRLIEKRQVYHETDCNVNEGFTVDDSFVTGRDLST